MLINGELIKYTIKLTKKKKKNNNLKKQQKNKLKKPKI